MAESFEKNLSQSLFSGTSEKTFIDKVLARQDIENVRAIIKKPRLNREDLLELLYLLSSAEVKMLNYGQWDRYVMAKYFVWIREFVAVAEQLYDYEETITRIEKESGKKITPALKKMFDNNMRMMEHNVKFLTDLYFNLGRTTLSLGASGFLELLKNKYEVIYPGQGLVAGQQKEKKRWFR